MKKQQQSETEMLAFMARIQEQIAALDRKLDALINKSVVQVKPPVQPTASAPVPSSPRPVEQPRGRQLYPVVCAECKKSCEIPFKPNGDRPVYCKECFGRRKLGNAAKPVVENKPEAEAPVETVVHAAGNIEPVVKEKKKSVAVKKSAVKKPVAKKKK
jgi:CxxC-x17-CxxC domain-containing protein